MRRLTVAPLMAALLTVTLTMAGCGSTQAARSPNPINTPTSLTTDVTSTAPLAAPATTPTSATPAPSTSTTAVSPASVTPQRCHTAELRVTQTPDAAAAGNEGLNVVFQNVSPAACTMYGYPGIGLLGTAGTLLNTTVARGNGSMVGHDHGPHLLTVSPDGTVSATLGFNVVESNCDHVTGLLVTPPDETASVTVRIRTGDSPLMMCRPAITALVPGAGGSTS